MRKYVKRLADRVAGSTILFLYKLILRWDYWKFRRPSAQRQLKAQADLIRRKSQEWGSARFSFHPVLLDRLIPCSDCGNEVGLLVNTTLLDEEKSICGNCWLKLVLGIGELRRFLDELKFKIQNDPDWVDVDPKRVEAYTAHLWVKWLSNPTGPESQKLEKIRQFVRTDWAALEAEL